MKMTYSSTLMINSLGKNYKMKQQIQNVNTNYLIAGILTGIFVGGVLIYFIQYKHTRTQISNMTNQNLKLRLENERQRISINGFSNQSILKPVIKESESIDKSSV